MGCSVAWSSGHHQHSFQNERACASLRYINRDGQIDIYVYTCIIVNIHMGAFVLLLTYVCACALAQVDRAAQRIYICISTWMCLCFYLQYGQINGQTNIHRCM